MEFDGLEGCRFRFPDERWKHIAKEHPEVLPYKEEIRETLEYPELVKRSKRERSVRLYYKYFRYIFGGKFILAVARHETPGRALVLTAYVTDKIKEGETLWNKE